MIQAAGAVLWRRSPRGTEIAIAHRPRYDDWSLAKGKLEPGETWMTAAVREVAEETGFTARLGALLGDVHYDAQGVPKQVRYWSAEAVGGEFAPNEEVDELRWVDPDEAPDLLTYSHDGDVVKRFTDVGATDSVLLLVRHAKAGSREKWSGDDDLRPLSGRGPRQAQELAVMLPLFGPDRVLTAPVLRCRATVAPFADAAGLAVDEERLVGEHHYWDDPEVSAARVRALAAQPGVTVVSSQGGVIPDLVERFTGRTEVTARKGSTWVIGFAGDGVAYSDYYETEA